MARIEIYTYPCDLVPTWDPELVNEVDQLLFDEESGKFLYSYRGKEPIEYSQEDAQTDIDRYKDVLWPQQKANAKKAGLIVD